jgi:hypothetical protein
LSGSEEKKVIDKFWKLVAKRKRLTRRKRAEDAELAEKIRGEMKKPLGHRGRAAFSSTGCIYAGAGSIA